MPLSDKWPQPIGLISGTRRAQPRCPPYPDEVRSSACSLGSGICHRQLGYSLQSASVVDTTFSTFSMDAYYLIERGQTLASSAYMIASVALSVGALIAALRFVRVVL